MKMEEAFKINQKSRKLRNDSAVQGTNDSSVLSKISTIELGYFEDQFLKHFGCKLIRRSPLVNRGYYIRAKLMDFASRHFLKNVDCPNQMINLGAGFDSSFFRLKHNQLLSNTLFIEIDFPDVINRKVNLIKSNEKLMSSCPNLTKIKDVNGNPVYQCPTSNYFLIGMDIRNTKLLEAFIRSIEGFSNSTPTLIISEVVLTYMAVNSCNSVIKWINEFFTNCALAIYEQINPHDGFGKVMCSHFKRLGSPLKCILKYPSEIEQINRYKTSGYTECFVVKASDYYKENISNEEKQRIDRLELFDEYEPWHLKCSHYVLISATKGDYCTALFRDLYASCKSSIWSSHSDFKLQTNMPENSSIIKISPFPLKFGIRLGHTMCCIDSKLFVVGGFGELATDTSGKHLRVATIEIADLKQMTLDVIETKENQIADRVFQCCTLNDQKEMLISFGRSNPSKLFSTIVKAKFTEQQKLVVLDVPISTVQTDLARFRHGSCLINNSNLFIYGGRHYDLATGISTTLNDAYLLENGSNNLRHIPIDESIYVARHSHNLCTWKNYIILSGGIDSNENPLNDIILFDYENNFQMKRLEITNGLVLERYSHTSHVIDDTLILIGGVNYSAIPPGICFIDLKTMAAFEFNLPIEILDSIPLIAINHQTHVLDKNNILLVGGGAICFTFGTHLNKQPIVMDISECWTKINSSLFN